MKNSCHLVFSSQLILPCCIFKWKGAKYIPDLVTLICIYCVILISFFQMTENLYNSGAIMANFLRLVLHKKALQL